jgi:uncharacterized protein YciU (UPF0263 family)
MPDGTEAPEDSGQAQESTEAPETGQATEAQESFTDFDPAKDIPEDAGKDWFEQKYNELRSGFTQKTQGLAQERQEAQELREFAEAMQDPATRDAILEQQFGYQFEDEGEEEFLDPEDELRNRVEQLEGHLTQQQQAELASQQENEVTEYVAEEIEALEKSQGKDFEFSPEELAFISTYAHTHPAQNGAPDVRGANDALNKILDQRKQGWIESKKSPRRISQGTAAQKTVEPKDRGERMELALEAMEDSEASG